MIGLSLGTTEAFGDGVIFNLMIWTTWVVVALAGVVSAFVGRWWIPLVAGVLVATLTEVYAVTAVREAFAPMGFLGPRNLMLSDVLPGFLVGVVLTFAVQLGVRLMRAVARGARAR